MVKSDRITSRAKFLLILVYLYGSLDMFLRFLPALIASFEISDDWYMILRSIYKVYYAYQYFPHILFTVLYAGIIRYQRAPYPYFIKYHVMHYLVLFTGEQFFYDIFIRLTYIKLESKLTLSCGIIFLLLILFLAMDCIVSVIRENYMEIPIVTDAVLTHIGDQRKK